LAHRRRNFDYCEGDQKQEHLLVDSAENHLRSRNKEKIEMTVLARNNRNRRVEKVY